MNFCSKCGHKFEEGEERCVICGNQNAPVSKETAEDTSGDNQVHKDLPPAAESSEKISFIKKIKGTKLRLPIIIGTVLICLIFGSLGIVKYTHAVQIKKGIELGNKYLQEGKYQEAILEFNKVIDIEPKNIEARVGLAKAYIKIGKPDEAEKVLKEAMGINPKKVEPYLELANLYIIQNNPFEAIKILTEGYEAAHSEKIKSMLDDLKSKLAAESFTETIILGENYTLPKTVKAKIGTVTSEYPVIWDAATVDTTKLGTKVFSGTLKDTDKTVKLTLNIIGITSIDNITATVDMNGSYSLPVKVSAKMSDGSTKDVNVSWNPSAVSTRETGSYNFEGTVSGYNNKVKLTLNVVGIASIENINKSININDKYSLPSKVTAKMTDGSTREVDVTWNPSAADTSKAGNYSYTGTVNGYNGQVKLTLNINEKAAYSEEVFRNLKGQPISKVKEKFGEGISSGTYEPKDYGWIDYQGFSVRYTISSNKVYEFRITDPKITISGIRCGMSGNDVKNKLGEPNEVIDDEIYFGTGIHDFSYFYDNIIFFFSDKSFTKVTTIIF